MLGDLVNSSIRNRHALGGRPDAHDALDLVGVVRRGGNDEQAGQEVRRNAVRGNNIVRAADRAHASVGREHHDRRNRRLQRPVEVCEALDVEHVRLLWEAAVSYLV